MRGHLEDEKTSWLVFFTCFFTYVFVSMTKNTYAAAISAIVEEGLFTKANVGTINASFYLFYGCTQMLGGILVDRFSPFKIMLLGVIASGVCNAVMATSSSYAVMLVVWSINGIVQFGVWPAVIKITSSLILPYHRKKALTYLSFAYPLGTIISYLVAAGVLKFSRWSVLFWISFFVLAVSAVVLYISMLKVQTKLVYKEDDTKVIKNETTALPKDNQPSFLRIILSSGLIFMTIPALIRVMLDTGLKNWVPTMIMESYGVSPSFANFLTTFLVIVNLSGVFLVNMLYPKHCKNAVTAIGIFFALSLPFLALVILTGKVPIAFIIISLALLTTFMIANSQLVNVIIPSLFLKQGRTGAIAGFFNTFGGLGCMVANYLYGYTADHYGWTATSVIWFVFCAVSIVFCLINAPIWKRFTANNAE